LTKLNERQEDLLKQIDEAKERFDAALADCKMDYEVAIEKHKEPLKFVVGMAAFAGIPARRIGAALGTKDHKTIKSYYPTTGGK
jgi:hypothetical protein